MVNRPFTYTRVKYIYFHHLILFLVNFVAYFNFPVSTLYQKPSSQVTYASNNLLPTTQIKLNHGDLGGYFCHGKLRREPVGKMKEKNNKISSAWKPFRGGGGCRNQLVLTWQPSKRGNNFAPDWSKQQGSLRARRLPLATSSLTFIFIFVVIIEFDNSGHWKQLSVFSTMLWIWMLILARCDVAVK